MLSPKTTYEVAFVAKMSKDSYGWHFPLSLGLHLPDGSKQERKESLQGKPTDEWFHIPVGQFILTPNNVGEISFSLVETAGHWKSGIVIKGVVLRPLD